MMNKAKKTTVLYRKWTLRLLPASTTHYTLSASRFLAIAFSRYIFPGLVEGQDVNVRVLAPYVSTRVESGYNGRQV